MSYLKRSLVWLAWQLAQKPGCVTRAGYVHVYGQDAPEKLMQRIILLEAEHARLLDTLPPHQRSHFRHRHKSASSAPGRKPLDKHELAMALFMQGHAC